MRNAKMLLNAFLCSLTLALGAPLASHQGKRHDSGIPPVDAKQSVDGIKQVNNRYLVEIEPIFNNKCFDCHATVKKLPWYAKIPGPRHLIERDIREAKKHMDMTHDFPFAGHGTPSEDIDALEGVIKKGSMPPMRYRVMHRGSQLTREEAGKIQNWIDASKVMLTSETWRTRK
ncbi:MAG: heme-binding domain-containing protein [Elusimicrobiota bacterium]